MAETGQILFPKTQLGSVNDEKPARLTIQQFQNADLFVTRVGGSTKPNYQLMYSLGDDIFLNTFSERLSMWELSGLHILGTCETAASDQSEPPFLAFYKEYNIKTGNIVNMSFAGITMKGYLVDMRIEDYTQDGIEGFKFTLKYLAMLQNLIDDANQPSAAGSRAASGSSGGLSNTLSRGISANTIANIRSISRGVQPAPIISANLEAPSENQ